MVGSGSRQPGISRAAVLRGLVEGHSAVGQLTPALVYAEQYVTVEPLHQRAQRQLMLLYVWASHPSAALRQYHALARWLADEVGMARRCLQPLIGTPWVTNPTRYWGHLIPPTSTGGAEAP